MTHSTSSLFKKPLICTVCQERFSRSDHLARHFLRRRLPHTYAFSLSVLVPSATSCETHPEHCIFLPAEVSIRFWTKAIQCISRKLRCDGNNPCSSCEKKNYLCDTERTMSHKYDFAGGTVLMESDESEQASDQVLAKIILAKGTDSFTENFFLPPSYNDTIRDFQYHKLQGLEATTSTLPCSPPQHGVDYGTSLSDTEPDNLPCIAHMFNDLFNNPFGYPCNRVNDTFAEQATYQTIVSTMPNSSFKSLTEQPKLEPERPLARFLIQSILTRAWKVPLKTIEQDKIFSNLAFLLTTARIERFKEMYFEHWHPNGAMVHPSSFDLETISLPLLTSIIFMGAMYSKDEMEVRTAKQVVDFTELFVFSSPIFSYDSEISIAFFKNRDVGDKPKDWTQFQDLQAGLIMVIAQYWSGSHTSRSRAKEERFRQVIKVHNDGKV
ncbi:E set domain-containing protein [Penicillium atrosanguineum]|uniref:E set domain-containing protein n=1 Tax=Penicillium atrosanguineum TaxID=1132637 RepID=UPI0023834C2B|nr:E set domain-containing protein [Penicillium atrosanguineum]KAJ5300436.1 E set domain-containing protein [Penicillium atrosanguineum]